MEPTRYPGVVDALVAVVSALGLFSTRALRIVVMFFKPHSLPAPPSP